MTGGFCAPRYTSLYDSYAIQLIGQKGRDELKITPTSVVKSHFTLFVQFYLWLIFELAIRAQELIHINGVSNYKIYSVYI
jgi:hypothetical protein